MTSPTTAAKAGSATPPLRQFGSNPNAALNSRAVIALTGLCYLFVGLGFSYLDRRYGELGTESFYWLVWAALGFGAGIVNLRKPSGAGKTQWVVLGCLGLLLALFPGLAIFSLLRWMCLTLMVVLGARAAVMRTRRDFYLTLTVAFVVSFMVGTNYSADWTLWFYLGPAWVFGGLALAWDYASDIGGDSGAESAPNGASNGALSRWVKVCTTSAFILVSLLVAAVIFLFAPRPPILGFGFLPPGTDTPGLFQLPSKDGEADRSTGNSGGGGGGSGLGGAAGGSHGPSASWLQQWNGMLKAMRQAASDPFIPPWQRSLMQNLLGQAQSLTEWLTGPTDADGNAPAGAELVQTEQFSIRVNWLLLLALLVAGYLLWRRRHRIGIACTLGASWLLAGRYPAASMRMSALALKWCLTMQGHPRTPGQSVREHWTAVSGLAPLAQRWLGYAVEGYCAARFGGPVASPQLAHNMRLAVGAATDILLGVAPELAK